jgi:hypothetical protein
MATALDIDTIEHLDFDVQIPCESLAHGKDRFVCNGVTFKGHPGNGSAIWRMIWQCPKCWKNMNILVCEEARLVVYNNIANNTMLRCIECLMRYRAEEGQYTFTDLRV